MTVYSHTDRQRSPAGNRRLAKKRVQYLNEALRFVSSLVLADSLVLRKSASSPSAKTLCARWGNTRAGFVDNLTTF